MKLSTKQLMMTAAVSGLLGGTAARVQAAPRTTSSHFANATAGKSSAGMTYAYEKGKHSCKGKNDCKGQGGCKSSDNGCKGKNSCKGKGGCATDGSKMPS